MTPAYLNPPSSPYPLVEQREDQHLKLFISPYGASSSLPSCPNFFDMTQDERGSMLEESQDHHYGKARSVLSTHMLLSEYHQFDLNSCSGIHRPISHGSCDHRAFSFSSSEAMDEDINNPHKLAICERGEGDRSKSANGPVQWMSSKMRLMQKMMEPNCSAANKPVKIVKKFQNNLQHCDLETTSPKISNNTIRVCADCNTTTTPLWRSGPRGPKSLCNACGIRQRKARRAMAEAAAAANGLVVANDISSTKSKVQNKEKKSRTSHFAQHKNKCKLTDSPQNERKLSFKDFAVSLRNNSDFGRVFPQDETEAAILLMELSCGLVHS